MKRGRLSSCLAVAVVMTATALTSCKDDADPVVILVTTPSEDLIPGSKVDYEIVTWSLKGTIKTVTVTTSDEMRGRKDDGVITVGKPSWKGHYELNIPEELDRDELRIDVYFLSEDSLGAEATYHYYHTVKKPIPPSDNPPGGEASQDGE